MQLHLFSIFQSFICGNIWHVAFVLMKSLYALAADIGYVQRQIAFILDDDTHLKITLTQYVASMQ